MQKNFIQQIEDKSQEDIAVKEKNINHLLTEENDLMIRMKKSTMMLLYFKLR